MRDPLLGIDRHVLRSCFFLCFIKYSVVYIKRKLFKKVIYVQN